MELQKSDVKVKGKIEAHYFRQCGLDHLLSIMPNEIKIIADDVDYILVKGGQGKVIVKRRVTGTKLRDEDWEFLPFWAVLGSISCPVKLRKRLLDICENWAESSYDH